MLGIWDVRFHVSGGVGIDAVAVARAVSDLLNLPMSVHFKREHRWDVEWQASIQLYKYLEGASAGIA